jgi:gliding motility-associated-like protein
VDSLEVEFVSSALILSANDSICSGDITTITAVNLNPNFSFSYNWSPDSLIVSPTITSQVQVQPLVTQYIYVSATASNGCIIEDSILIAVSAIGNGLVNASASETLVPEGGTVTLVAEPNGLSYQWSPEQGVTNPTMQTTTATINQTTLFTLTATDGICTKSDTVLVQTFGFICEDSYIYIPNAFSPNGDAENDILYVRGQLIDKMIFRVFDRWGEMVFESQDRSIGWDGTFRGKKMDPDVYDYYLKAVCIDGDEAIIKGNITLLK